MKVPGIAIRNSPFILILVLISIILGIMSFVQIPRAEDPAMDLPFFNILIAYPGTNPEDMEQLVVDPMEEVLVEIDDISEIRSKIGEGVANIFVEASFAIDTKEKLDEIIREITRIKKELPEEVTYDILQLDPGELTAIYQYAIMSGSDSYAQMRSYGEDFKKELEKVDGVKRVYIEACPKEEVRISLDFQKMSARGLSLQQIIHILNSNNKNIPGGAVKAQNKSLSISTTGAYKSVDELRKTILASNDGSLIRLEDIAKVDIGFEDQRWIGRYNQKRAVWITIKMKKGANILTVAKDVKKAEADFKKHLPDEIYLETVFEQAPAVRTKIDEISSNLLQGMVLVGVIIFLFIGWRAALIIVIIIPLSILIGLALLNGSGFALQQVSIAALILALGLLVDNGIVVIESIDRYLKEGLSLKEAAAKGAGEVGYALISSTTTTILAFYPLAHLGFGAGEFIQSLPLTVTFTLLVSLVLALTLSPVLASNIMRNKHDKIAGYIDRILKWTTKKIYRPGLDFSLRFGWFTSGLSVALLVFSLILFKNIGLSLFPPADKPMILVNVETPQGSNINSTDNAMHFVEQVLDTIPYVKNYAVNIGHSNPQIYYNRFAGNYESNRGQILVNFSHWDIREFYKTLGILRNTFTRYPSARITVNELINGLPGDPVAFHVIGENRDTLKKVAQQVEEVLKNTPGVINVNNPLSIDRTGLEIALNKEKAGFTGLSYLDFDQMIRAASSGLSIGKITLEDDKNYEMKIGFTFDKNIGITDFDRLHFNAIGGQVPLRQIADIQFKSLSPEILHLNTDRCTKVTADVTDADRIISITQEAIENLSNLSLPRGYEVSLEGAYEDQQEIFGNMGIFFFLVLLGIFAVLVFQFKSIFQPFIILSAVPFAVSGSFIMLYLTGWSFSFLAFIGLISISGIVVNDSILIVDQINQLRAQGVSRMEAIKTGSERRLVPVILTSLTTILSLLPLAISQSNMWTPICITIIGGMISATFMILLIVPLLYKWFSR